MSADNSGQVLSIVTEALASSPKLRYLPPNYHTFGLPPTQADPFELNTVEVNNKGLLSLLLLQ